MTAAPSAPATVSAMSTMYGRVLVVGSGQNAGCSLYVLTSDALAVGGAGYACTSVCATNVWPALLTHGAPVAGPGINPTLLGTVARTDVLTGQTEWQVTYAGQPLYRFFGDVNPGNTNGANLFDPLVSPPGVWYLVSPARGLAAPGVATLGPENVGGSAPVLSTDLTGVNSSTMAPLLSQPFPVYTFSADQPPSVACVLSTSPRPGCSVFWPPVLTTGRPQAVNGLNQHDLGIIVRPDGSHQVTYMGQPLYLFIKDAPSPGMAKGNGINAFGGTFNTVPLP